MNVKHVTSNEMLLEIPPMARDSITTAVAECLERVATLLEEHDIYPLNAPAIVHVLTGMTMNAIVEQHNVNADTQEDDNATH